MSDFVPNSFQMPNAYVDRFWHLLTSDEKDVLVYIARRIYGFHGKSCDGIALSQFVNGIVRDDGTRLDYGTGLSKGKVLNALKPLIYFRLVIVVREAIKFPPSKRKPAVYALQLEYSAVDVSAMERRAESKREAGKARLLSANQEKEKRKEFDLCGSTDEPHGEVSSHDTNNYQVPNKKRSTQVPEYLSTNPSFENQNSTLLFEEFDEEWSTPDGHENFRGENK